MSDAARAPALTLSAAAPKLQKLIPLLASDNDGEVVATARATGRTLKQAGADFHDLAAALAHAEPRDAIELLTWGDIPASEQAAWLSRIAVSTLLSPWEQNFAGSILAQVRFRPGGASSRQSSRPCSIGAFAKFAKGSAAA